MTDIKSPIEPISSGENLNNVSISPTSAGIENPPERQGPGRPPGAHVKDPETGISLNKDGAYHKSSGTGPNLKRKVIPPVDMAELVKKGLTPTLYTNWDPDDPDSNWTLSYRKFTPERKQIYLTHLEQTGIQAIAARWAGVSSACIRDHRKEDPHFDLACNEAEEYYHAMCAASILSQARVGMIDEKYDKAGNVISRRVSYETRLRELMLKRARPDYNETQKQEMTVMGGAVVVPAPIDSVESWEDVVKRHTGGGTGALAGAGGSGALAGGSPPELGSGTAGGNNAVAEGRVIKRSSVNGAQRTLIDGERSEHVARGGTIEAEGVETGEGPAEK